MYDLPRYSKYPLLKHAHLDLVKLHLPYRRGRQIVIPRIVCFDGNTRLLPSETVINVPKEGSFAEINAFAEEQVDAVWQSGAPIDHLFHAVNPAVLFHLLQEENIVWVENPEGLPYVRQEIAVVARRDTAISMTKTGRLLGYAILKKGAPPLGGHYYRRYFRIKDGEPTSFGKNAPGEAVATSSIAAGEIPQGGRD
jgi:hypothetical protein